MASVFGAFASAAASFCNLRVPNEVTPRQRHAPLRRAQLHRAHLQLPIVVQTAWRPMLIHQQPTTHSSSMVHMQQHGRADWPTSGSTTRRMREWCPTRGSRKAQQLADSHRSSTSPATTSRPTSVPLGVDPTPQLARFARRVPCSASRVPSFSAANMPHGPSETRTIGPPHRLAVG